MFRQALCWTLITLLLPVVCCACADSHQAIVHDGSSDEVGPQVDTSHEPADGVGTDPADANPESDILPADATNDALHDPADLADAPVLDASGPDIAVDSDTAGTDLGSGDSEGDGGVTDAAEPLPCTSDCVLGEILECLDDDTILGCWIKGWCDQLQTKDCPPGHSCIPGKDYCYCPDSEELVCKNFGGLYKKTQCDTTGSYVKSCLPPGCAGAECVANPPITQIAPWPTGHPLFGAAAAGDGYFVVGDTGAIVQKVGGSFQDLWALHVAEYFLDVSAYSTDHAIALSRSMLAVRDGDAWDLVHELAPPAEIVAMFPGGTPLPQWEQRAMWSPAPGIVYTAGNGGTIYFYDGKASQVMQNPHLAKLGSDYADIWGSAPDDVYAVGYGEMFVHYDGTSWKTVPLFDKSAGGIGGEWRSVHGRAANDVYATRHLEPGKFSEIWHFDGADWSPLPAQPDASETYGGLGIFTRPPTEASTFWQPTTTDTTMGSSGP